MSMSLKRLLPFTFVLVFTMLLNAVSLSEVYNATDVVAILYNSKISLLDLDTGNEANVSTTTNVYDLIWDFQGMNLLALQWVYGNSDSKESKVELRLIEISLPSANAKVLASITPYNPLYLTKTPLHAYLVLDKNGSPAICAKYFNSEKRERWEIYTYDYATKTLPRTGLNEFDYLQDGFSRKHQPKIATESGKYYSRKVNYLYRFFTYQDRKETELSDPSSDEGFIGKLNEPYRFCESPDGTFVLISYQTGSPVSVGVNYVISTKGFLKWKIRTEGYLGDSYFPHWTSKGQMVYLNPPSTTLLATPPALQLVGEYARFTTVKQWSKSEEYPKQVYYRVK